MKMASGAAAAVQRKTTASVNVARIIAAVSHQFVVAINLNPG
jgi:hypothetical protein